MRRGVYSTPVEEAICSTPVEELGFPSAPTEEFWCCILARRRIRPATRLWKCFLDGRREENNKHGKASSTRVERRDNAHTQHLTTHNTQVTATRDVEDSWSQPRATSRTPDGAAWLLGGRRLWRAHSL